MERNIVRTSPTKQRAIALSFIAASTSVTLLLPSTARADEPVIPSNTPAAGEIVEDAISIAGELVESPAEATVKLDNGTVTTTDNSVLFVPSQPDEVVSMVSSGGAQLGLGLPDLGLSDGVVAPNGAIEFDGSATDITVIPTETGGVQALISIANETAPTTYAFDLQLPPGATAVASADGSIAIAGSDGEPLATVEAPWAVDANGAAVPTTLEFVNGQLIQTVAHSSEYTAYPVVADPRVDVTWYGLVTVKVTSAEWSRVKTAMDGGLGASGLATLICGQNGNTTCVLVAGAIAATWSAARVVLNACANSKGVDIHVYPWVIGAWWCSGY